MAKKFQSTHPHGVRHDAFRRWSNIRRFQSTHPHGVRRKARPSHARRDPCFNPRTHTGCDAICRSAAAYRKSFNPRTHTGCDSGVCSYSRNAVMFQSTHPHGVRRLSHLKKCLMDMFQSTHPHGVRRCQLLRNNGIVGFQSTHPHGVRLYRIWFIPIRLCVSIHAPTRGATLTKPLFCKTVSFQSTHPHGVRRGLKEAISCFEEFQSTHPHGVRRDNAFILQGQDEFQSTHPHGVRHSSSKNVGW